MRLHYVQQPKKDKNCPNIPYLKNLIQAFPVHHGSKHTHSKVLNDIQQQVKTQYKTLVYRWPVWCPWWLQQGQPAGLGAAGFGQILCHLSSSRLHPAAPHWWPTQSCPGQWTYRPGGWVGRKQDWDCPSPHWRCWVWQLMPCAASAIPSPLVMSSSWEVRNRWM